MAKTKQEWVCPKCGNRVVLFVPPTDTPSCENFEKHHSTRYTPMELRSDDTETLTKEQ